MRIRKSIALGLTLCAIVAVVALIAYFLGQKYAIRDCNRLNAPSHLLLLLDFREQIGQLPAEVLEEHGIRVEKYDALIAGFCYMIISEQDAVERALAKKGNNPKAIDNLRETLERAKEIENSGKYDVIPVGCEILSDFIIWDTQRI